MDGMKYREYQVQVDPGAKLFGMTRTVDALNQAADKSPEEILQAVNSAVESVVGDAEQFDDLTMMCIEYRGKDR